MVNLCSSATFHRVIQAFLVINFVLVLGGCASVPLGTMLKFSTMDESDFAAVNPAEIRAKIHVDEPVTVDITSTQMTIEIDNALGVVTHKFPLELVSTEHIVAEQGFFSDKSARTEYVLKFSDKAIESFNQVQDSVINGPQGQMSFSVNTSFGALPPEVERITFSIFLMLSEQDDYVTLFEDAELDITHEQTSAP